LQWRYSALRSPSSSASTAIATSAAPALTTPSIATLAAAIPIHKVIVITSTTTLDRGLPETGKTARTISLGCFWVRPSDAGHMTRARWTRERWFDLIFLVGFGFKAIDGVVELVIGLPLLVLRPMQVDAVARLATATELREDPNDLIAHLIRHGAASLSAEMSVFAAVYLIVHGLVKLGIVAAIFRGSRRLYPWAIAALGGFVIWQAYEFVQHPSIGLAFLTLFDVVIVALTLREWRHHRSLGDAVRSLLGRQRLDRSGRTPRRGSSVPSSREFTA